MPLCPCLQLRTSRRRRTSLLHLYTIQSSESLVALVVSSLCGNLRGEPCRWRSGRMKSIPITQRQYFLSQFRPSRTLVELQPRPLRHVSKRNPVLRLMLMYDSDMGSPRMKWTSWVRSYDGWTQQFAAKVSPGQQRRSRCACPS